MIGMGVCIGDARKGSGCGYEGGKPGDTCPECGGMVMCCARPSITTETVSEAFGERPPIGPEIEESISTSICLRCGWSSAVKFTKRKGQSMRMEEL